VSTPKFIPIPRAGTKCPHSGLCRSTIYNLIGCSKANGNRPVVESTIVRLSGNTRGSRRVCYASLMRHLQNGVVPVERLHLRKMWSAFRKSRRRPGHKPLPVELPPINPDDLPEDVAFFSRAIR
jgi:hypothetical protein